MKIQIKDGKIIIDLPKIENKSDIKTELFLINEIKQAISKTKTLLENLPEGY